MNSPIPSHQPSRSAAPGARKTPFFQPKNPIAADSNIQRKCAACEKEEADVQRKGSGIQRKESNIQRKESAAGSAPEATSTVDQTLQSSGQSLDTGTRDFMESRFGYDFSQVRIHNDPLAHQSSSGINALAYTHGEHIVFGAGQYQPETDTGKELLAHELTHTIQQGMGMPSGKIQRRDAPYIKKVTVHLKPPQTADLEWEGTAPADADGKDHFTVSTGKGYSDKYDDPGTCTRNCCTDAMTQCAPPWNEPGRVGACCTYYGSDYWTGVSEEEHGVGGWKWWTPIQPYYSQRGIALHQHDTVTGDPIGHGCVRMENDNAKRIHDYSNGRKTNVTIDERAAPVDCQESRKCGGGKTGQNDRAPSGDSELATNDAPTNDATIQKPVPGLEGEYS